MDFDDVRGPGPPTQGGMVQHATGMSDNFVSAQIETNDQDEGFFKFDMNQYSFFGELGQEEDGMKLAGALEEGLEAPPEEEGLEDELQHDLGVEEAEDLSLASIFNKQVNLKTDDNHFASDMEEVQESTAGEDVLQHLDLGPTPQAPAEQPPVGKQNQIRPSPPPTGQNAAGGAPSTPMMPYPPSRYMPIHGTPPGHPGDPAFSFPSLRYAPDTPTPTMSPQSSAPTKTRTPDSSASSMSPQHGRLLSPSAYHPAATMAPPAFMMSLGSPIPHMPGAVTAEELEARMRTPVLPRTTTAGFSMGSPAVGHIPSSGMSDARPNNLPGSEGMKMRSPGTFLTAEELEARMLATAASPSTPASNGMLQHPNLPSPREPGVNFPMGMPGQPGHPHMGPSPMHPGNGPGGMPPPFPQTPMPVPMPPQGFMMGPGPMPHHMGMRPPQGSPPNAFFAQSPRPPPPGFPGRPPTQGELSPRGQFMPGPPTSVAGMPLPYRPPLQYPPPGSPGMPMYMERPPHSPPPMGPGRSPPPMGPPHYPMPPPHSPLTPRAMPHGPEPPPAPPAVPPSSASPQQRGPVQRRLPRASWMSADEMDQILRIQFMAVHMGSPYSEDYYYQSFMLRHHGGRHVSRDFVPVMLRDVSQPLDSRTDNAAPRFVGLEGLGKLVLSNIRTPKMLMDVGAHSAHGDGDGSRREAGDSTAAASKPLEKEPLLAARMLIEDCCSLLLDVEDVDRLLVASGGQRPDAASLRERRALLLNAVFGVFRLQPVPAASAGSAASADPVADGVLVRVVSLAKGRKLLARSLKAARPPEGATFLMDGPQAHSDMVTRVLCALLRNALRVLGGANPAAWDAAQSREADAASGRMVSAAAEHLRTLPSADAVCQCMAAFVVGAAEGEVLPLIAPGAAGEQPGLAALLEALLLRAAELGLGPRGGEANGGGEGSGAWPALWDAFFVCVSREFQRRGAASPKVSAQVVQLLQAMLACSQGTQREAVQRLLSEAAV